MTSRVLIVSHEAPGHVMSGPAIRYWHLARVLGETLSVQLAVPGEPSLAGEGFEMVGYRREDGHPLATLAAEADVVLLAGFLLYHYPFLKAAARPLVIDLYDPFVLENLEIHRDKALETQAEIHAVNLKVLNEQLRLGDFFICAHETQRDFWLGMLTANERVNPYTVAADRTLRHLIDLTPFGLPEVPPRHRKQVLKGIYPGIGPEDRVIYWGGGLWEWFDPLTAIRAVVDVAQIHPEVRLFFAGTRHPNPDVPEMRMCQAARQLSDELDATGRWVFFNDWVPYQERENYLLEADVGLSLHFSHIETRFSFRTRLLDYIWAGLPMVITSGDTLSRRLGERGLARTVAPADTAAVREALLELLDQADARREAAPRFATLQAELSWERVAEPLRAFCRDPHLAADHQAVPSGEGTEEEKPPLITRAWRAWRERGLGGLLADVRSYLRWRLMTRSQGR
jgi:glycosyltransferase involved in cell wall biosynthesis